MKPIKIEYLIIDELMPANIECNFDSIDIELAYVDANCLTKEAYEWFFKKIEEVEKTSTPNFDIKLVYTKVDYDDAKTDEELIRLVMNIVVETKNGIYVSDLTDNEIDTMINSLSKLDQLVCEIWDEAIELVYEIWDERIEMADLN